MLYQVGDIRWLKPDDPSFDEYGKALDHALSESHLSLGTFIGIWTQGDGELLTIVYDNEIFSK